MLLPVKLKVLHILLDFLIFVLQNNNKKVGLMLGINSSAETHGQVSFQSHSCLFVITPTSTPQPQKPISFVGCQYKKRKDFKNKL